MPKPSAYARLDIEIRIDLPEGLPEEWDGDDGSCPEELKERLIEALVGAYADYVDVYIDGEDKEPARVHTRVTYMDVTEVRAEG